MMPMALSRSTAARSNTSSVELCFASAADASSSISRPNRSREGWSSGSFATLRLWVTRAAACELRHRTGHLSGPIVIAPAHDLRSATRDKRLVRVHEEALTQRFTADEHAKVHLIA